MNSLADEDAVLQELGPYLGIEETEREPIMPSTIQKYHKMVASNNEGSVFDNIYYPENGLESASCTSAKLEANNLSVGLFTDKKVIRIEGGRGNWKTGKNSRITFKRAEPALPQVGLDNEELIHQQLRKVNPTGYSNEVTENSVRQNQKARSPYQCNSPGALSSPSISSHYSEESSKSSSPAFVTLNSSSSSSSSSSFVPRRNTSIFDKENDDKSAVPRYTYVPSGPGSSCSSTASESRSSIPTFDNENGNKSSSALNPCAATFVSKSMPENINKAKPITEILNLSRKQYKYRKSQQLELTKDESNLASEKKIEEILYQDAEEDRQRKINDLASQTSNLSVTGRANCPPWRSYTNASRNKDKQNVNINSVSDFPPLK